MRAVERDLAVAAGAGAVRSSAMRWRMSWSVRAGAAGGAQLAQARLAQELQGVAAKDAEIQQLKSNWRRPRCAQAGGDRGGDGGGAERDELKNDLNLVVVKNQLEKSHQRAVRPATARPRWRD